MGSWLEQAASQDTRDQGLAPAETSSVALEKWQSGVPQELGSLHSVSEAPRGAQKVPHSFRNSSPITGVTPLPLPRCPGSLQQLGSFQAFPKAAG